MISAVSVAANGECSQVHVRRTDNNQNAKWSIVGRGRARTPIYVHYEATAIDMVLLSPTSPEKFFKEGDMAQVVDVPLPTPLDTHIYPAPLIVVRIDNSTKNLIHMSEEDFCDICAGLISECSSQATQCGHAAVYDVPAMPILNAEDNESVSADEEEDEYDSNDDAEDIEEDDDEDWDDDESIVNA